MPQKSDAWPTPTVATGRHVGLFPGMPLVDLGCGIGRAPRFRPEALAAARTVGTAPWTASFAHPLGEVVYGNDSIYPRGAVAYSDAAMRRMMVGAGLVPDRPYVKGSWSGLYGDRAEDGQRAAILRPG
ncbi:MAG: hypothetical protein RLZZ111_1878 [Planctomycetota bacterium]|jgi:hypothetical protein